MKEIWTPPPQALHYLSTEKLKFELLHDITGLMIFEKISLQRQTPL